MTTYKFATANYMASSKISQYTADNNSAAKSKSKSRAKRGRGEGEAEEEGKGQGTLA